MALIKKIYYVVGVFSVNTTPQQFANARDNSIAQLQSLGFSLADIKIRGPFDYFDVGPDGETVTELKVAVVEIKP